MTIGKLRDHLSAHLRAVQRGAEIVVMDRSTPVARIVGYVPRETGEDPVLADLSARGKARAPLRDADWEGLDGMPGPRFEGNELLEALLANREEDR